MSRSLAVLAACRGLVLAAVAGIAASAGCFGDDDVKRCTTADDCAAPFLCCTGGVAVDAQGGPHCVIPDPSLSFCDAYLPHLVEGNPCGRVPAAEGAATVGAGLDPPPVAADQCRDGLTCCATTLACAAEGDCPAGEDVPADATSSGASCSADDECTAPEICCGISFYDREGTCALVRDCPLPGGGTGASSGGG